MARDHNKSEKHAIKETDKSHQIKALGASFRKTFINTKIFLRLLDRGTGPTL